MVCMLLAAVVASLTPTPGRLQLGRCPAAAAPTHSGDRTGAGRRNPTTVQRMLRAISWLEQRRPFPMAWPPVTVQAEAAR